MSANNVICYEGIQRVYRNAVVQFLRASLTRVFPQDFLQKLRSPFQSEEWEAIKRNASASRDSGDLQSKIIDDFDLLSVSHFFNLFDKYSEVLLTSEIDNTTLDNKEKNRRKTKLLNWIKTIKDLRDPLSHPGEEDFTREDSFVLLDCARRVLMRLELGGAADQIKTLMDRLLEGISVRLLEIEPLEDQLPPRESIVIDFVGRQKELTELWEWFDDPVSRRWALAGEGGKGKSALAYSFAFDVKVRAPQPFQTVLWLSAKRRRFLEGKTIDITEPDFSDFDSALNCLLNHYGWIEEIDNPLESKRKRVLELLNEFPAFLIVDDIDSLQSENENVIEFFSLQVPGTKSKILFTSRRVIFGLGGTTTHVTGFELPDGERFILSRCELMELDPAVFDKKLIQDILRITEGSPLYIEDLMRLMAMVSPKDVIRLWEEKGGTEARRYTLGRECELLTPDARKVLLAACICIGATSFAEVEGVTGLSSERVTAALQELQRLFLVPKPRLIEGEQRFEVNINTRTLVREVYGTDDLYRRIETTYRTISQGISQASREDVSAIVRQAVFLVKASKYQEAEQLLTKGIERYHSDPDLTGVLGWVYKAWHPPRITDAREKFLRAWQLKSSKQEMYEHWCKMELREQEWSKAAAAAEKGLKILPENKSFLYFSGYARSRLGKELLGALHQEKGKRELSLGKEALKAALRVPSDLATKAIALNGDIYRALVLTCEVSGDYQGMDYYFKRWRKEYPDDPDADSEWERLNRKYPAALSPES